MTTPNSELDDKNTKRVVGIILDILDEMKKIAPHATLNSAQCFLVIATNPGWTSGEVQKFLGLPTTSTSRALSTLYKQARGKPGMDLVRMETDAIDTRIKHLYLNQRGLLIWRGIRKNLTRFVKAA